MKHYLASFLAHALATLVCFTAAFSETRALAQQGVLHVSGTLDVKPTPRPVKKPIQSDLARREIENGALLNEVKLFSAAREACSKGLLEATDPILKNKAKDCITKSIDGDKGLIHSLNESTYEEIELLLDRGEIDQALSRIHESTKIVTGNPNPVGLIASQSESSNVDSLVREARHPEHRLRSTFAYKLTSSWAPWFVEGVVKGFLILAILIVLVGFLYGFRTVFGWFARTRGSSLSQTRWIVWSIDEAVKRGGAGAIMDALQLNTNPLLMDYEFGTYKPASLLLAPAPLDGKQTNRVWWNFLGDRVLRFPIESIPIEEMRKHSFDLREAFSELDVKVPGAEIRGVVGLVRNYQQWLYKGLPAVRAVIASIDEVEPKEWSIRITSNYEKQTQGIPRNISVYASAPAQPYTDAVGLAATRAGFKLFYRLAVPDAHGDHVTAIASFHQGVQLLLLLL